MLTRERINQRVLHVLRILTTHFEEQGRYDSVETYARKLLELEPWDEQAHQVLMRVLAQNDQRNAALVQYETCRRLLEQEFGVAPARETSQLYESIRDGKFARRTPTNVPIPLTSFVGREREIVEVKHLLGTSRLLTLTGAGGCGKTRLAMRAARDLVWCRDDSSNCLYNDGVWWIDLAPLNDPALVPQTLASIFDLRETPNQSLTCLLTNYFHSKDALLILDNCEHLIGACAQLVGVLLSACPKLHFLVTSRERLNVSGECVWYVPSLACPQTQLPLEQLRQFDAIQLFTERARAVAPNWSLAGNGAAVTQICAQLDGIPLAIELAAARLNVLSAEQIQVRLADQFNLLTSGSRTALPRHQTLRATLDWSYDLLSDIERSLFARLGIFLGGCTFPAIEAICCDDENEITVLDRLTLLIDKSLLQRVETDGDEPRLNMLETIRKYAAEKLNACEEAEVIRRKHLAYFTAMVEESEPKLWGSEYLVVSACLEKESGNFAAALDWALGADTAPDIELGARLAGALSYYWYVRGSLTEGRRWLERAISKMQTPGKIRAKILAGAAMLATQQGDYRVAREYFEESIPLWRKLGSEGRSGLAEALHHLAHLTFDQREYVLSGALFNESRALYQEIGDENISAILNSDLGMVAYHQGDYATARARFEESLTLFQARDNQSYIAETLIRLGDLSRLAGSYAQAVARYEESLALFRAEKSKLGIASGLHKLGYVAQHCQDYLRAKKHFAESLTLQKEEGNKQGIAECLAGLAGLAVTMEETERALRLFGAARALLDTIGAPLAPADLAEWERDEKTARAQLDEARFDTAWAEGQKMTLEQAIEYALKDSNT